MKNRLNKSLSTLKKEKLVEEDKDFDNALDYGLNKSPIHEVLVEQSVSGWKEYELELLRDKNDKQKFATVE